MSPLPTRPIDDAGPLKGKTPPILISVAEIPGSSAPNAGPLKNRVKAATIFHLTSIARPPKRARAPISGTLLCFLPPVSARPAHEKTHALNGAAVIRRIAAVAFGHLVHAAYSSFLEPVKRLD